MLTVFGPRTPVYFHLQTQVFSNYIINHQSNIARNARC